MYAGQRVIVKTGKFNNKRDRDEALISEQLSHLDTHNSIVKFRGWSRNAYLDMDLHTYIAYAPFGSLDDLVNSFLKRNKPIPEIFIWLTIRDLVRACQLLESQDMVHPDIKFDNIFLDEASGLEDYPGYCNPVLGDFGLST
jgi:serine/threonine protein kinase